jgi:hypothetical protein
MLLPLGSPVAKAVLARQVVFRQLARAAHQARRFWGSSVGQLEVEVSQATLVPPEARVWRMAKQPAHSATLPPLVLAVQETVVVVVALEVEFRAVTRASKAR